jgi:Uma2 family endonuclease
MLLFINDHKIVENLKAYRRARGIDRYDEVWNGLTIITPPPDNLHQELRGELSFHIGRLLGQASVDRVFAGVNVSDREAGWLDNVRVPDVAVFLAGTAARDCGTHWVGGPDLAVEILSPGDIARVKRGFYAQVGVRELLYVDRQPWSLELYRLRDGELELVGVSAPDRPDALVSSVLPLTFRLVPGAGRPRIEVVRTDGEGQWVF